MYLLIDNYDSFTYNLWHFLGELGTVFEVHRNDAITVEEAMKLSRLIQSGGVWQGQQLLHPQLTAHAASLAAERGFASGWMHGDDGESYYETALWLTPYLGENTCVGRIPFMLGYGGNFIGLMPGNMIALRFADHNEGDRGVWDGSGLQRTAQAVRPFCQN